MSEITINAGTLVALSGLPGSGKSRLQKNAINLPQGAWVSTDNLRDLVLGTIPDLDENQVPHLLRREAANATVFSMARAIVKARLTEGLVTVVDATNLTEADRKEWADLAAEAGAPFQVLILSTPLEQCLLNNARRETHVPARVIREMLLPPLPAVAPQVNQKGEPVPLTAPQGFTLSSSYDHRVIDSDTVLRFAPNELGTEAVDVVGDTHGLLADLLALLASAGWVYAEGHLSHPQGRKLLFLGDMVDRGPQSIELLTLVKQAVRDGVAEAIKGNHEKRLVSFYDTALTQGIENWRSYANAETGMQLLKLPAEEAKALVEFMRGLPSHKVLEAEKIAFVHGDMHRFEPMLSLASDMVHGQSGFSRVKVDSDAEYQIRFDKGLNEYTLFRGHIPQTSSQNNVFSLERQSFQKGELVLMHLDQFLQARREGQTHGEAFAQSIKTQQCAFDFELASEKWNVIRGLEQLVGKKLATRQLDESGLFRVYKYSKQAFWGNLWNESAWLLKARGMVLDAGGGIVSHPFDKCFNYHENGAGDDIPDSASVVVVDKLNGFLGIISGNPVRRSDLLVHTQGGFGGPFVEYIKEYAYATPTRGNISRFLAKNDVTLLFEVLHPADPHIIAYSDDMYGLHLIGVRGKGLHDKAWTEEAVDLAAAEMGLRRPSWTRMTFGALRQQIKDARSEGWMVREDTAIQEYLLKIKTPYYLTTKFLGRLSKNKIAHMYGNPENFKRTVDEEVYPIVDAIVTAVDKDTLANMGDVDRVSLVRELINQLQ